MTILNFLGKHKTRVYSQIQELSLYWSDPNICKQFITSSLLFSLTSRVLAIFDMFTIFNQVVQDNISLIQLEDNFSYLLIVTLIIANKFTFDYQKSRTLHTEFLPYYLLLNSE